MIRFNVNTVLRIFVKYLDLILKLVKFHWQNQDIAVIVHSLGKRMKILLFPRHNNNNNNNNLKSQRKLMAKLLWVVVARAVAVAVAAIQCVWRMLVHHVVVLYEQPLIMEAWSMHWLRYLLCCNNSCRDWLTVIMLWPCCDCVWLCWLWLCCDDYVCIIFCILFFISIDLLYHILYFTIPSLIFLPYLWIVCHCAVVVCDIIFILIWFTVRWWWCIYWHYILSLVWCGVVCGIRFMLRKKQELKFHFVVDLKLNYHQFLIICLLYELIKPWMRSATIISNYKYDL